MMTATAEVYFIVAEGGDRLCTLHDLTVSMPGGILVISGDIHDGHEDVDMFADIIHIAEDSGHRTRSSISSGEALPLRGIISEVVITADHRSRKLVEDVEYELDREAGFIIFKADLEDVDIDFQTDGYDTCQGGGGVKGIKTDDHPLDLRLECDINGFAMTMHMRRPFVYRKGSGQRLHIRSERFPAG